VCQDEAAAVKRFGVQGEGRGIVYTRTGRRFFADDTLQHAVLERLATALDRASFWDRFQIRTGILAAGTLERFVRREPLRRVHECVFGVLALESEPLDPRL
jgi:PNKP adenylyltransferase domain, ligase domain